MAAQCGLNNAAATMFVSSSAYYGYVPVAQATPTANQVTPATDSRMDVDVDSYKYQQQQHHHHQRHNYVMEQQQQQRCSRKRVFGHDELYMPRFKRFREGDCFWAEDHGLAQMYHEPPLLRLSPAADFDMACQPVMTGNLKFQSDAQSRSSSIKCQELEDMLLMTHGCSSYHHYRQSHPSQASDNEEAEF